MDGTPMFETVSTTDNGEARNFENEHLRSTTCCFVCFSDLDQVTGNEGNLFSFRHIFHYLNDSTKCELKDLFPTISKGFSTMVCSNCLSVSEQLSQLCLEMEVIRLKLHYSMSSFHRLISKNPYGKFASSVGNEAESVRTVTREKCEESLKNEARKIPVVNLSRLSGHIITFPPSVSPASDENESEMSPLSPEILDEEVLSSVPDFKAESNASSSTAQVQTESEVSRQIVKIEVVHSGASTSTRTDDNQPTTSKMSDLHQNFFKRVKVSDKGNATTNNYMYCCRLCPKTFWQGNALRYHTLATHPHQLFTSYRLNTIPEVEFKRCCGLVLEDSISVKNNEGRSNEPLMFYCFYCEQNGTEFSSKLRRFVQLHLIKDHYKEVCLKLEEFQTGKQILDPNRVAKFKEKKSSVDNETEELEPMEETNKNLSYIPFLPEWGEGEETSESKKRWKCTACGTGFSLEAHLRRHHLRKSCAKTTHGPFPCPACKKLFNFRKGLINHVQACKEVKKRTSGGDVDSLKVKILCQEEFRCDGCGKYFSESSSLRRHKLVSCSGDDDI